MFSPKGSAPDRVTEGVPLVDPLDGEQVHLTKILSGRVLFYVMEMLDCRTKMSIGLDAVVANYPNNV